VEVKISDLIRFLDAVEVRIYKLSFLKSYQMMRKNIKNVEISELRAQSGDFQNFLLERFK